MVSATYIFRSVCFVGSQKLATHWNSCSFLLLVLSGVITAIFCSCWCVLLCSGRSFVCTCLLFTCPVAHRFAILLSLLAKVETHKITNTVAPKKTHKKRHRSARHLLTRYNLAAYLLYENSSYIDNKILSLPHLDRRNSTNQQSSRLTATTVMPSYL